MHVCVRSMMEQASFFDRCGIAGVAVVCIKVDDRLKVGIV